MSCCTNMQVWFIEVNSNPCLELSSPYLARIIPRLLEHVFRLTVDVEFPAGPGSESVDAASMPSHEDTGAACGENRFSHVFHHEYAKGVKGK
jgi:Tubulin-tyrosine ligase family